MPGIGQLERRAGPNRAKLTGHQLAERRAIEILETFEIEENPAMALLDELRDQVADCAVRIRRAPLEVDDDDAVLSDGCSTSCGDLYLPNLHHPCAPVRRPLPP